jgi:hypothetical protein
MSTNDFDLRSKYEMNQPPEAENANVGAIQVVQRTRALVTRETDDTAWLFDPVWNPAMWELANRTMCEMPTRLVGCPLLSPVRSPACRRTRRTRCWSSSWPTPAYAPQRSAAWRSVTLYSRRDRAAR